MFGDDPALSELRDAYAIPANSIPNEERMEKMKAFFFWTSWACATERPGKEVTYTQNWPPEPLIDNRATGPVIVWSVISFVLLLAGVGGLAWYFAVQKQSNHEEASPVPEDDPLRGLTPTPSMSATLKYFWIVAVLLVVQVILGAVTAHYGVEGSGFMDVLRWLRVIGDTIFAVGVLVLGWFVLGLKTGWSTSPMPRD